MADKGYDVAVRLSGKDDLSSVVKRPKNAVDELSQAADPKAKGAFASFSRSAITHLSALKPVLDLVKRGLSSLQSVAMSAFRHIVSGAKLVSIALMGITALMIKWGSDVVESENLFKVSMGEMVSDAERWAELTARALRMNENDIKKYLGTFNVMLVSMGLAPAKAYEMSKAFTKLTYDLASFYNLAPEEAFEKLQAGITGEIEPLKRLGIIVNDTAVQHYALAKGIGSANKEMTEAEKILARYGLIMERTSAAQGDMERTADSASNIFKAIWAAVKQTIQEIGKGLIETKAFAGALAWVGGLFAGLRDKVNSAKVTETIDKWTASLEKFFMKTLNIDERLKNLKERALEVLKSIPIGGTVTETKVHSSGFKVTREEVTRQRTLADLKPADIFKGMGDDIKKGIGDAFDWIEKKLLQAFKYIESGQARKDWNDFKEDFKTFKEAAEPVVDLIKLILKEVWNFTKEHPKIALLVAAFILLAPAITALMNPFTLLAVAIGLVILRWDDIVEGFKVGIKVIGENFRRMGLDVQELWLEMKKGASVAWDLIKEYVRGVVLDLKKTWQEFDFWKTVESGWEIIKKAFAAGWEMLKLGLDGWMKIFKAAWDGVLKFFGDTWEAIKSIFNSAVEFIGNIWDSTIGKMIDKMITFLKWLNLYETHSPSAVSLWSSALTQMDKDFDKFSARVTEKASSMVFSMAPMPAPARGYSAPAAGGAPVGSPGNTSYTSYHNTYQLPPEAARNPLDPERYALAVRNVMLRDARSGI